MILGFQGHPGGLLAPSWKQVLKKSSKDKITQSYFGKYLGSVLLPNRFHLHFLCANFYACFWHCCWEASGPYFEDFGVISGSILNAFDNFFADVATL